METEEKKELKSGLGIATFIIVLLFEIVIFSAIPTVNVKADDYGVMYTTKSTLVKGQTIKLKVYYASDKVKWKSSNKKVASVSSNGKVTAKKKGTATIYAIINNKKLKCKIKVEDPKISKKTLTIKNGDNFQLSMRGTTQDVTWSSSNEKIVSINYDGVVMTNNIGTAKITAKIGKKKYYCKINVVDYNGSRTRPLSAYIPYTTDINRYGTYIGKFKIQLLDYKDGKEAYDYITRNDKYREQFNSTKSYIYVKYSIEYLSGTGQVSASNVIDYYSDFFNGSANYELDSIESTYGFEDIADITDVSLYPGGSAICSKGMTFRNTDMPLTYRLRTEYDEYRYRQKYTWFTTKR